MKERLANENLSSNDQSWNTSPKIPKNVQIRVHLAFIASTSAFSVKKEIFLLNEKSSRPELPSRLRPCYFHHVHRLVVSLTFPRRYVRNTANQPLVLRVISVQRTGHNKSSFLAGLLSISKANCRR